MSGQTGADFRKRSGCVIGPAIADPATAGRYSRPQLHTIKRSSMSARRFIALGASVAALVIGGPIASATAAGSADQTGAQASTSQGSNSGTTSQGAGQTQSAASPSCTAGCGGSGQAQQLSQSSDTT